MKHSGWEDESSERGWMQQGLWIFLRALPASRDH